MYRWFLLLMATEDKKISEELEEIAMSDSIIKKAVEQWDWLSQDEETRARYRSRMMAESDRASVVINHESLGQAFYFAVLTPRLFTMKIYYLATLFIGLYLLAKTINKALIKQR
ncbi:MAG: hypothetical protein PHX16_03155 [Syntrophaceticus sp.]|nr:hypothetical protein [Syntrophaceticus sp.]MDD4359632.1 hypothetical protein [Syntrophaceticus sp.]MDD4782633.1 hypothetical protein [Syntrophaceticus sp.]